MRNAAHPAAGQTVTISSGHFAGSSYWIEDWWENIAGKSWMDCDGNAACLEYAIRSGVVEHNPLNDDVVYGKIEGLGKLMHVRHLPNGEAES